MGKVVGVFGGSFNPLHEGHLGVGRHVLQSGLVDEVWFMPCRRNPLKEDSPEFSADSRIGMIEKALKAENEKLSSGLPENLSPLKVTDIELRLPEPSYSWLTLQTLSAENPGVEFKLIMGADSYRNFSRWVKADWIRDNYPLIVYPRPGYPTDFPPHKNVTVIDTDDLYDVSSTDIRKKINAGSDIPEYHWLEK